MQLQPLVFLFLLHGIQQPLGLVLTHLFGPLRFRLLLILLFLLLALALLLILLVLPVLLLFLLVLILLLVWLLLLLVAALGLSLALVHLRQGRRARLADARGALTGYPGSVLALPQEAPVKVTERIRPDCVYVVHGYGRKAKKLRAAYGRGIDDAELLTRVKVDPIMGGTGMNVNFVRIERATANDLEGAA